MTDNEQGCGKVAILPYSLFFFEPSITQIFTILGPPEDEMQPDNPSSFWRYVRPHCFGIMPLGFDPPRRSASRSPASYRDQPEEMEKIQDSGATLPQRLTLGPLVARTDPVNGSM